MGLLTIMETIGNERRGLKMGIEPSNGVERVVQQKTGRSDITDVVVIPAYNEAQHIGNVVQSVLDTGLIDHVIAIDDASVDETAKEAEMAGAEVLQNDINLQTGGAIKRGYAKALELDSDIIYRLDADGQHNPENLKRFREAILESNAQYVLGNRFADSNFWNAMPFDRLIGNHIMAFLVSLRARNRIFDPSCGYRAIESSFLRQIPYQQFSDDFRIDIEELIMAHRIGAELRQVPVDCIYEDEESTLSYFDAIKMAFSNTYRINPTTASENSIETDD